jgi:hypothetical protein
MEKPIQGVADSQFIVDDMSADFMVERVDDLVEPIPTTNGMRPKEYQHENIRRVRVRTRTHSSSPLTS